MEETAKVKETVHLYRKLWRLPSSKVIFTISFITLLIGVSLISYLISGTITGELCLKAMLYFGLILFIPPIIDYILALDQRKTLSLRRLMAISYINFVIIIVVTLFGFIFYKNTTFGFSEAILFAIGFNTSLRFLAILAMWKKTDILGITSASSHGLTALILAKILDIYNLSAFNLHPLWIEAGFLIMLIFAISEAILFYRVNKPFLRDLNVSGLTFFRGFSAVYLSNDPQLFEEAMDKIAQEQNLRISEINIWNSPEKDIGTIVIPEVHPGPFREVGSSAMPVRIIDALENVSDTPAVLHGTCTHTQNLTKSLQISVLINTLKELREKRSAQDVYKITTTEHNDFKLIAWRIGDNVFLIVTRAPKPTDDIELELAQRAINAIKNEISNMNNVVIVDAHNCIVEDTPSLSIDSDEAQDFINACIRAAKQTWNMEKTKTKVGTAIKRSGSYKLEEGIGKGGISVFTFEQEDQKIALISIDGNNANCEFRTDLINIIKERGYNIVELTTSDTHTVNAISMSSKGYLPVGTTNKEKITAEILSLLDEAEKNMQYAQFSISSKTNKLRVYGKNGFEKLTKCVIEAARIAKYTGITVSLIAIVLSIAILLMI